QIKNVIVDKNIDVIYPNEAYHWVSHDLFLDDINHPMVKIKQMLHFFKTIGLRNFGEKTAEKFYEYGFEKAEDVIKATVKDFLKIKGFGVKKANNYYDSIHSLLKRLPLDKFVLAAPYKTSGRKLLKTLFKFVPNLFDLSNEQILKCKVPGFGPVKLKNVTEWVPKVKLYLDSFVKEDLIAAAIYNKDRLSNLTINSQINNKNFVFSGFLMNTPDELEDYIYDHGGDVIAKIDKSVNAVICGNVQDLTEKVKLAYELNIPVYTVDEFVYKYNVKL